MTQSQSKEGVKSDGNDGWVGGGVCGVCGVREEAVEDGMNGSRGRRGDGGMKASAPHASQGKGDRNDIR